ncbi:alpha/beta fold hydrolase [Neptuniibacter sp. QD34_54]|uniref:alpha/beta fold hydrolase n=1 Tax=Neptuniibacter sp. QD34_54 TaxID=3398208 RepID=UPI0039F4CC64
MDPETALTLSLLSNEIGHQADLNDQLDALAFDQGPPALALSSNGQIVGYNSSATSILDDLVNLNIFQLGVNQVDFNNFKDRTIRHQGPSILRVYLNKQTHTSFVFTGRYQSDHQLFLLQEAGLQWSKSMDTALHDIFKLTKAEREVLVCLARGLQTEQISLERQSKISTVRQQIKSILQKLGVTSQTQATALAATLGNQTHNEHIKKVSSPDKKESSYSLSKPVFNQLQQDQFVRNNRRVGWRRYGKKGGKPVLLMHSTYFGAGEYAPERVLANQSNLDVIIVERPGYGKTQAPLSLTTESILDTHIKDCYYLLNKLGWEKAWLTSHDFGFVSAAAFANHYPEKVLGLYAISPPPLFSSNSNLSSIPVQQRAFIWAARHCFWMIKLLLRLSHVQSRKLGPTRWLEMAFDGAPEELEIFKTEAGREVSEKSYHFNLVQNSKGQVLDLQVSIANDWAELLREVQIPLAGLTGQRNTTFDVEAVRELTSIKPTFIIDELEMASLTMTLTDIDTCYTHFLDFIKSSSL